MTVSTWRHYFRMSLKVRHMSLLTHRHVFQWPVVEIQDFNAGIKLLPETDIWFLEFKWAFNVITNTYELTTYKHNDRFPPERTPRHELHRLADILWRTRQTQIWIQSTFSATKSALMYMWQKITLTPNMSTKPCTSKAPTAVRRYQSVINCIWSIFYL